MQRLIQIGLQMGFALVAAGGLIWLNHSLNGGPDENSESVQISELWAQDFKKLGKVLARSRAPQRIKDVSLVGSDETTQQWIKAGIKSPVPLNPEGDIKLEVLVIQWKSRGRRGCILQQTFIHIPTGNTLFELGRTYRFDP